ncbi:MAG: hypothetical protein A2821_00420 [Candidatus Magasanikbacteria bacterium RIFCSPHIGHO2_01_FULL_41_23]|uniref:Uncharacterized protein n=1 Tax=Candidatus Magasanikbacteria bacterium RIFCSPLOWO2_01_FULL_40_15 TaxID=1798686 RepID=A0A1F6N068_9BACT|nr:MAG: hypothetical protein A2821_00420 [Candidatus Magasanikbacteria bacterium RIFCSPHIGHO2_01_FULL_41_23]OGH74643.1 MAG: hypothetical protein A3F22_01775 [Candidatus Magasanikbacteria bacterium RIFCSPHIGHO2_12_FULL_41_16]OGH77356.1 MAG: hypothetical protein A2983_01475 [Candidatus Magasanikbacteria bacterium RIFCSPLOWO2_01_FULL_40_15]
MSKDTITKSEITTIQSDIKVIKKSVCQVEKKIDGLEKRFDVLETRVSVVETKLDFVIDEVGVLKEDMEYVKDFLANEVMTKQDKNEIMSTLDVLVGFYKKSEQEQTLQTYRIREHTEILEKHDKEIKNLQLAVAT